MLTDDSDEDTWEEEESVEPVKCLFCEDFFDSVELAIPHCASAHDFDLLKLNVKFSMDFYGFVKLVNFIRSSQSTAKDISRAETVLWEADEYMKPTLEFDPWLMFDYEEYIANNLPTISESDNFNIQSTIDELKKKLDEKEEELKSVTERFLQMREFVHTVFQEDEAQCSSSIKDSVIKTKDAHYFDSYSHHGIHFDMLSDKVRTLAYKDAIEMNSDMMTGKCVLDLGCGTGILSMFAASAGAIRVYGIDNSDIVNYTREIIKENKLDNKIEIVKSLIEDDCLPVDKVDVIISEWMGYFLLFEGMLDSLIYARDRYLIPGGLLLPNACRLRICGAKDIDGYKNFAEFWSDVYGYKMSCVRQIVTKEAIVETMPAEYVITNSCSILNLDLYKCSMDYADFQADFVLTAEADGPVTAFVGFFDVNFDLPHVVTFSTGPANPETHWKQTVFYVEPIAVVKGESLKGSLNCRRKANNKRALTVAIVIKEKSYEYCLE